MNKTFCGSALALIALSCLFVGAASAGCGDDTEGPAGAAGAAAGSAGNDGGNNGGSHTGGGGAAAHDAGGVGGGGTGATGGTAPGGAGGTGGTAAGGTGGTSGAGAGGTAGSSGLQRSGRWLTYNDQYTYIVGIDAQQLAADPALDYAGTLDQFINYRINKVRVWLDAYWEPDAYLHPWPYSGGPNGTYDLDQWNDSYWQRLRSFVSAAKDRGVIVEVSLFSPYPSDPSWWTGDFRVAWNKDHNVNGVFSTNASGHFYPEFFQLDHAETSTSGKTLQDYQQALVDKGRAVAQRAHHRPAARNLSRHLV